MKYSKLSNKSFTATMKHLLLMAFAILTIGCGEKKSEDVNLDELEDREGVAYLKNSDSPYTGKVFEFHDNGQKKSEITLKDGEYDGPAVSWHENGQKDSEGNNKDGKLHGPAVICYENGQKKAEANYKDGKVYGPAVIWYENGQKLQVAEFKDGKLVTVKVWLPDGSDCPDTNVQDGNGIRVFYDEDGEETSRDEFKDGTRVSE
jgi:antitoxin component YwqK of YwqJK toxin-antitoxin module